MTTNIQWTDETWNPIVGCSRISPGCSKCYAATAAASARLQQFPQYQKVKDWDGTVEFVKNQLLKPLSWKKPKKIFVCSMSDLFHENVPDEWIDKVMAVAAICPQHTFQILTKRPERALEYFTSENRFACIDYQAYEILRADRAPYYREHPVVKLPLKNVWIGTTVENQAMANKRIPLLLQIPAVIRWLSVEPLLGEIDLREAGMIQRLISDNYEWENISEEISWVVVGGESGSGARPCNLAWMRSLARQCQDAEVPAFVKQLGSRPFYLKCGEKYPYKISDKKGGVITDFPEDLQIRQFPKL
ncbi:phage Gp37/Gp68 family protein [Nostoc sp. FACHB-110]|uniref:phage Gp37/Gp68 family protein n=1 Tax=Nostoc sp. FACHB-110 TaxID=2692834 RepID=UPI0016842D0D|nr:phage Gp37/Gp68 family protein [Nostoc sp. FACHB-110]MBD2437402.1 phage Gp37/Gp68 family protein [Nostoc sp. FACHB-110]